ERWVEQVTSARERLDDVASLLIAKNLPKHIDLLIEAALADDTVGPAMGEQLLATDHFPGGLDQTFEHTTAGIAQFDPLLAARSERWVEQVTSARERLDDVASLLIAKNLPKHIDLLIEAALADDTVGPAMGEQLLATDHFPGGLDQTFEHTTAGIAQFDPLLAA